MRQLLAVQIRDIRTLELVQREALLERDPALVRGGEDEVAFGGERKEATFPELEDEVSFWMQCARWGRGLPRSQGIGCLDPLTRSQVAYRLFLCCCCY